MLCRKPVRDKDGWPTDSQVSHLCHHRSCCRPDHLQLELRVCNVRRNYCGILSKLGEGGGGCDCGMVPPCVCLYTPEEADKELDLCTSQQEVANVLAGLKGKYPFKLLPREQVRAEATKNRNAAARVARGAKSVAKSLKRSRRDDKEDDSPGSKKTVRSANDIFASAR